MGQGDLTTDLQSALIRFGVDLLSTQLGQSVRSNVLAKWHPRSEPATARVQRASDYFGTMPKLPVPSHPVVSIFCLVKNQDGKSLADYRFPQQINDLKISRVASTPAEIWNAFCAEFERLALGVGAFETFTHLMAKYGATTCGSTPLQHISVNEQFKAVAALAFTLEEDKSQVCLVSGDIPGIQEMLYTITSKGAAKGLRGRSFYLQLLSDAIVRCILRELDLLDVCVVFDAGGNFKLIARASDAARLSDLYLALTRRLLALHQGELRLALAWTLVEAAHLADSRFAEAVKRVDADLVIEKRRPWEALVEAGDDSIFDLIGFGSLTRCAVCDVEIKQIGDPDDERNRNAKCDQCTSFEELAKQIAKTTDEPYLSVTSTANKLSEIAPPERLPLGKARWDEALKAFGYAYRFADKSATEKTVRYRLNDADFLDDELNPACGYAFRPLANQMPRVTEEGPSLKALQTALRKRDPTDETDTGDIRSTTIMSEFDSTGIERFGVLRMDVDWLGDAWQNRLTSSGPADPHHTGEAYDVRTRDFPNEALKQQVLDSIMQVLGWDRFFGFIEAPGTDNEHIHVQKKKGTIYP